MAELRDYIAWHRAYDDPESGLSWRLQTVQDWLRRALDEGEGPRRSPRSIVSVGGPVGDTIDGRLFRFLH